MVAAVASKICNSDARYTASPSKSSIAFSVFGVVDVHCNYIAGSHICRHGLYSGEHLANPPGKLVVQHAVSPGRTRFSSSSALNSVRVFRASIVAVLSQINRHVARTTPPAARSGVRTRWFELRPPRRFR